MARASLSAPLEFQRSMPLLREVFRDLADLRQVPLPNALLDLRDALAQAGFAPPVAAAADVRRWLALLPQRLRRAHKFSLGADFTALVTTAMEQPPAALERMLATARVPFDEVWIEWPTLDPKYGELGSEGCLISALSGSPAAWEALPIKCWREADAVVRAMQEAAGEEAAVLQKVATIAGPSKPGYVSLSEYQLHFAVDGPIDRVSDTDSVLGREYAAAHRRRHSAALESLANQGRITMTPLGAYGDALLGLMPGRSSGTEHPVVGAAARLQQYFALSGEGMKTHSLWRRLIVILALMSTHIGGSPLIAAPRVQRSERWLTKGRVQPAFEYRVLTLYRPVEAPKLLRRAFPQQRKSDGIPLHEVAGAWHHRRAPAAHCQQYPGSCALATWEPVLDEEEKPVGADQQRCALCARKRWFIAGHPRGDRQFGVIEKSYQIRASRRVRGGGTAAPPLSPTALGC